MNVLVELAIPEDEIDARYPYTALAHLRDLVIETTTMLDTDFAPDNHHVYIRLPIGGQHEC